MSSKYEFWLTDDSGRRLGLLNNIAFISYSRSTHGYGTIQLGLPYNSYAPYYQLIFQPDWRIDVWRSPEYGFPLRREGSFLLRKYHIYDRKTDSMRMIEFYGRSPIDILRRWTVIDTTPAVYSKTEAIDDMMKDIVTEAFITTPRVVPTGEFTVDGNVTLGPVISHTFQNQNVLDILKDLKAASFYLNKVASTNKKIYFDVVEGAILSNSGFGYEFRTYAGLRGVDRTNGITFSVENGNLQEPDYIADYLDEVTEIQVGDVVSVASDDQYLSRWNRILEYRGTNSTDVDENTTTANQMLQDNGKKESFNVTILNTPGGERQPRSLYGIDWDLGDLLPVSYAGKNMNAEVQIVYVSLDETGKENIIGMNVIGGEGQEA